MPIYLDTHVIVWLYQKEKTLFSPTALESIEENHCLVSPATLLELEYLFEISKIKEHGDIIIDYLYEVVGLEICPRSFEAIVVQALQLKWTRDPFDRIITAHASLGNNLLLTKNRTIHAHYTRAFW
jgi:PIN domain nuclease of toxin-antitoxin system